MHRREWRLGLSTLQYGVLDQLQIGTQTLPWIILMANLQLRSTFWQRGPWALSAALGFYRLDLRVLRQLASIDDETDAAIWGLPTELAVTRRVHPDWHLSALTTFNFVRLDGVYDAGDYQGAAALSALQLKFTATWTLTDHIALLLHSRLLLLRYNTGSGAAEVELDPDTSAQIELEAQTDVPDPEDMLAVVPSVAFHWRATHLRLGLSIGNYEVPFAGLLITRFLVVPDMELYWRF
ncbi:MAG: hypothetical protein ACPGUV_00815 [Polyangiales bacterium]